MKALIIEDENKAAKRLAIIIKDVDPNIEIIGRTDGVKTTLDWFRNNESPDLIFLDIHLSDGRCFEIFDHLEIDKPIIFTTAYDEFAIQAFKHNTIDYLLKPIKKVDVMQALNKLQSKNYFDYSKLAAALKQKRSDQRILVKIGNNLKLIDLNNTAYVSSIKRRTIITTKDDAKINVDYSLDKMEAMLDKRIFYRINRQFIVNIEAISKMTQASKSRVRLTLVPPCNEITIVSTDRSSKFKKWLVGEAI